MQLHLGEETRIRNIQDEFNAFYPFLKIDFLKDHAVNKNRTQKTEKINSGEQIKLVGKINGTNKMSVNKQRTVAQVKKDFKEMFGLTAEVFRKSGNVWIETSLTDDWTLEQQNNEGKLISMHGKSA